MSASKHILVVSILSIIALLFAAPGLAQGPRPQLASPAFIPGEVIIKFQPHVGMLGAHSSLRAEDIRLLETSVSNGMLRVQVTPGQEAQIIAKMLARGDVEFATYNYRIEAFGTPNDPGFSSQWALNQFDDHDIDAPEAWDIHTGSSSITIAVIDTGVDLDHPDLQANIVSGYDFVNDDTIADDDHGHGTHVAGIAAAVGNNGIGIAGVSWKAKIMPLKVLNAAGSGSTFDLSNAIYYAVDHGAQVINMSLGAKGSSWPCEWTGVEAAFNYAVSNGVLLVVASGNDGKDGVSCPGAYDQVMAVGNTTSSDTRAGTSNYGPRLDIAAPGSSIYSTYPYYSMYASMSGTSMATPHVAGLAALIWSFVPSLNDTQVRDTIQNTADDLIPPAPGSDACSTSYPLYAGTTGWDPCFGHGRINAWRALESVSLQTSPAQLPLLIDDETGPVSGNIEVITANPNVITWTATISPTVPWLTLSSPPSGSISAASSPDLISLVATTNTITYDTYTTTVVVTGTTALGGQLEPQTTEVQLHYVPQLFRYRFPIILKDTTP